jgi:hypothetical protein
LFDSANPRLLTFLIQGSLGYGPISICWRIVFLPSFRRSGCRADAIDRFVGPSRRTGARVGRGASEPRYGRRGCGSDLLAEA